MTLSDLYKSKDVQYFGICRSEIVNFIPKGPHRILEIGCGSGSTGFALKETGRAQYVAGIEISESGEEAKSRLDKVYIGNVEDMPLPVEVGQFDYIIMGDVIEHLIDPWKLMGNLSKLLKSDGQIVATIPNVRNWKVVLPLLFKGAWTYSDWGLLDRGHLRFFTKDTMKDLFLRAGMGMRSVLALLPRSTKSGKINFLTFGIFEEFLAPHYLIVARKKS